MTWRILGIATLFTAIVSHSFAAPERCIGTYDRRNVPAIKCAAASGLRPRCLTRQERSLDKRRVDSAFNERRMAENILMDRNRGLDSLDAQFR
jgi:hypothetical protein